MPAVDDVQSYLALAGIVDGSSEWPSVRRRVHDGSNRLVVITEDGGGVPEIPASIGVGSAAQGTVNVQVRVRGEPFDGDGVADKMAEIRDALHGLLSVTLGSSEYIAVAALTAGPALFYDENGRVNMTTSFAMTRAVAPVASF